MEINMFKRMTALLLAAVVLSACGSVGARDPFVAYDGDYLHGYVAPQNANPFAGNFYFPNLRLW